LSTGIGQRVANAAAALSGAYDVKAYGATGDGKTLDTPAINKAIEAAAAAGGGIVWIPAGNYLCFSIRLKSNVAPHLDEGATIIAADTPAGGAGGYDPAEPNAWDKYQNFGHSHFHNSLIWAKASRIPASPAADASGARA
jgi:polygalacturonase